MTYRPFPSLDKSRPGFLTQENIIEGDLLRLIADDPAADGHGSIFLVTGVYEDGESLDVRTQWCDRARPATWVQEEGGWRVKWQSTWTAAADGYIRSLPTCEEIRLRSPRMRWFRQNEINRRQGKPYVDLYEYYHGNSHP